MRMNTWQAASALATNAFAIAACSSVIVPKAAAWSITVFSFAEYALITRQMCFKDLEIASAPVFPVIAIENPPRFALASGSHLSRDKYIIYHYVSCGKAQQGLCFVR